MTTAFQADAFQADVLAFQIDASVTPSIDESLHGGKGGYDPYIYRTRRKDKSVKEFYEDILGQFIEEPTPKAEAAIEAFAKAAERYADAVENDDTITLTNTLFDSYQKQFNRVVKFIAPAKRAEFAAIVDTEEEELEFLLMVLDLD